MERKDFAIEGSLAFPVEGDFFDLVIVGGGLVGAGLAAALRHSALRIALVDARAPNNDDPRLFALNSSSCRFLDHLGLWPKLAPHAAPIRQVHVSYQGHFGSVRLDSEEINLPTLGYVVPARHIESALNEILAEDATRISIYRPAALHTLRQQHHEAQLTIVAEGCEKILRSSLVFGADGTESTVRKQLGIAADVFDYGQCAIVARVALKRSHEGIAYERFTNKQGAIAMLPLMGDECAIIWTANSDTISRLMALSEGEFLHALQKEFGYRLGRLQHISYRHVFPLRRVCAEKAVDQCVFLLGNAAHTLHPIAAQGFNLALYEVAALVEGIMEQSKKHGTFTAKDLQQINEKIQKQQAASIGLSHRLPRLFSGDSALFSILLQAGMVGLDLAAPIKRRFIKRVMGRVGYASRLLL